MVKSIGRFGRTLSLAAFLTPLIACGNDAPSTSIAPTPTPAAGSPVQVAAAPKASPAPVGANTKMAPMPGTVVRATELKDKPALDAKTLKPLAAQTAVTVVDRQGGWLRVTAAGQSGWVRLLHVSTQPTAAKGGAAQDLEAAKRIATGRAGSGNIVATSGIRGLSEEQLRTAAANPEQLKKLEGFGAGDTEATDYARTHGLDARRIKYPAAPQ